MRKFIPISIVLCVVMLVATVVACRSDELVARVQPKVEQRADTFSLSLDLGNVPFESRITATQPIVGDDKSEKSENIDKSKGLDTTRQTRAALVVGNDGKTTINLTLGKKKDVDVFLILRNGDGSRIAVANSTWSVVDGETTKLKTNGQYTFTWVKGSSNALREDEMWYLDAMTGGEWDATTKAYNINKECTLPNRMFNPGESVELGEDIHVPFGLGTNALGSERKWGVRMYVVNGHREAGGYSPRLVCLDPEPSFSPYGSLLCMRFRNAIGVESTHGAEQDPVFAAKTVIPSNYSYFLRRISVESTSSTTGGCIRVAELGGVNRQVLPWHPYKVGGVDYTYTQKHQEPFYSARELDKAKPGDYATGYYLQKGTLMGSSVVQPGPWTPYYYLWVKSIDESKNEAIDGSDGLKVRCLMYNHTVKPDKLNYAGSKQFSRVFISSKKMHKSGRAYFTDRSLDGEIFMPATFYMAPDIIYKDPLKRTLYIWPDSAKSNQTVAREARFTHAETQSGFAPGQEFAVDIFKDDNDQVGKTAPVRWIVPSPMMIRSVFPGDFAGLNAGAHYSGGALAHKPEKVNINGRVFQGDSYYYNPWDYDYNDSKNPKNYHVFYGLKFVGTPYCEVVRYTLYGQWYAEGSSSIIPDSSRLVVHSKHLGDVSFANDADVKAFFEKEVVGQYMNERGEIKLNPKPQPGVPPSDKFWGDFWHPKPEYEVSMRVIHLAGKRGLGSGDGTYDLGRALTLASFNGDKDENGNITKNLVAFEITDAGRTTRPYEFKVWTGNNAYRFNGRASILPFISPIAYNDDPVANESH